MADLANGTSVVIKAPEGVLVQELTLPREGNQRHLAESETLVRVEEQRRGGGEDIVEPSPTLADFESALAGQDFIVERRFRLSLPVERRDDGTERTPQPVGETQVQVSVGAGEEAIMLVTQDGVLRWLLPETVGRADRRGEDAGGERIFRLDRLPELPVTEAIEAARRGVDEASTYSEERRFFDFGKMLREGVEALVLRFTARVGAQTFTTFLERDVRTGFVTVESDSLTGWRSRSDLEAIGVETWTRVRKRGKDAVPRILFLSHGTFSNVVGSFGHLTATSFGQDFLRLLLSRYDLIIGYDHRTLGQNPLENAIEMLAGLERIFPMQQGVPRPIIDAFCYSRGGLVFRSLTELLLPSHTWKAEIDKVIFVGCTNGGTVLAEPDNWHALADTYTNTVYYANKALQIVAPNLVTQILSQAISGIGAFVKALVSAGVEDNLVPGLAAMRPKGDFVTQINKRRMGQPLPSDVRYYAITSIFSLDADPGDATLPQQAGQFLVGRFTKRLYGVDSDLVVHTTSMTEIDPEEGSAPYIPLNRRFEYGKTRRVTHTIYFLRPETVTALGGFLTDAALSSALDTPARSDNTMITAPAIALPTLETTVSIAHQEVSKLSEDGYVVLTEESNNQLAYSVFSRAELRKMLEGKQVGANLRTAFRRENIPWSSLTVEADVLAQGNAVYEPGTVVLDKGNPIGVLVRIATGTETKENAGRRGFDSLEDVLRNDALTQARRNHKSSEEKHPERIERRTYTAGEDTPVEERRGFEYREPSSGSDKPSITRGLEHLIRPAGDEFDVSVPRATTEPTPVEKSEYFTQAEMKSEVVVGEITPVLVTLSREEIAPLIADGAIDITSAQIEAREKVQISILALANCEVIGETYRDIDPPTGNSALTITFAIRATHVGSGKIRIQLAQHGINLEVLMLLPKFVETPTLSPIQRQPSETMVRMDPPPKSDESLLKSLLELTILEDKQGNEERLVFFVRDLKENGGKPMQVRSEPLGMPRDKFIANLYSLMEKSRIFTTQDYENLLTELQYTGAEMFRQLVPKELQRLLWSRKADIKSIFVLSYEPVIPWEFIHLCDPDTQGGISTESLDFLGLYGLTRWVDNASYPYSLRIRSGKVRHLQPDYAKFGSGNGIPKALPEAAKEVQFVATAFGSTPILPASSTELRSLLKKQDQFDLIHIACHGEADSSDSYGSRIILEGELRNGIYQRDEFRVINISQGAVFSKTNPPLVVLNNCRVGRVGLGLTGMGGFAQAFCRAGAGAFIAPLWSIQDGAARAFIETWYQELRNGKTLSEATIAARLALIKDKQHPGWLDTALSYSVYGYPHARVLFE